jgi:hypothetical protein
MDHRYSTRLPLQLTVEVSKQEQFLGRFKTRNMDVEGVFIEMRTTDLKPNDIVKLVFFVTKGESVNYTLDASVVRVDDFGVGMILVDDIDMILELLGAASNLSKYAPRLQTKGNLASINTVDYAYSTKSLS